MSQVLDAVIGFPWDWGWQIPAIPWQWTGWVQMLCKSCGSG